MTRQPPKARGSMERYVAGAAAGMFVANGAALAAFVVAWHVMGADRALVPGTWQESDLLGVLVVLGAGVAGAIGGAACEAITRRWWVVWVTAAILLGWWSVEGAITVEMNDRSVCEPRAPATTFVEGARAGLVQEPAWSTLASPLAIGAGMLLGGLRSFGRIPRGDDAAR